MKLLYGTGNPAKAAAMQNRIAGLGIELISLQDLRAQGVEIPDVPETGNTPLENARQKAHAGVHVRTVNGVYLTDEQMLEHYIGLVRHYGRLTAKYRNAICYVQDEEHVYEAMEPDMESEKFWLTDVPHSSIRREGFPLDSISLDPGTGKYFYDLPETAVDQVAVEEGFLTFFRRILQYR